MLPTQFMRAIHGLKRLAEKLDAAVESHPYCKYCNLIYRWISLAYPFLFMQRILAWAFELDVMGMVHGYESALMVLQVVIWCHLCHLVDLEVKTDVEVEKRTAKLVKVSGELLKTRKELVKENEEVVRILKADGVGPKEIYHVWMKQMEREKKQR